MSCSGRAIFEKTLEVRSAHLMRDDLPGLLMLLISICKYTLLTVGRQKGKKAKPTSVITVGY